MNDNNNKKLVSLSESTRKNSSAETSCPKCKGSDQNCNYCHGVGSVTKAKASRYK